MKLKLTKSYEAEVSDEDFEWANQWKWSALTITRKVKIIVYAVRGCVSGYHYLHRDVASRMGLSISKSQVDHRDRDSLNNTRENLRVATASQNQCNRKSKGYWFDKSRRKWRDEVTVKGTRKCKRFGTEKEAVEAVSIWRNELHGDFACN